MNRQIKAMLQSLLDSIQHPAYIEQDNKIILLNNLFKESEFFNIDKDTIEKQGYKISEKNIYNKMKIIEIKNNDIEALNICKKKINEAMALL
jgi:hypothetical protein